MGHKKLCQIVPNCAEISHQVWDSLGNVTSYLGPQLAHPKDRPTESN